MLATERLKADAVISDALYIPQGTPVGMVRRLGEADGRPVSLADHYFNLQRFPDIVERIVATGSVSVALEELGLPDYLRKVTRVTTRLPDRLEAELLQQPRNRTGSGQRERQHRPQRHPHRTGHRAVRRRPGATGLRAVTAPADEKSRRA